jgi:hypothetical protein
MYSCILVDSIPVFWLIDFQVEKFMDDDLDDLPEVEKLRGNG